MTVRDSRFFTTLREELGGIQSARVYKAYYDIAKNEADGSVIELGTGQGGSTISFALGVQDSGRPSRVCAVDRLYQKRVEGPHPASWAEHGEKSIAMNEASIRDNFSRFGVSDIIDLHVGQTTDADIRPEDGEVFSVLAIDVDGRIDRDLAHFFDRIETGGWIIIDDYMELLVEPGFRNLSRYRKQNPEKWEGKLAKMPRHKRLRLLGKHLLTYRLANHMAKRGLFVIKYRLDSTVFCRKQTSKPFSELFQEEDLQQIEDGIVRDFKRLLQSGRTEIESLYPLRWVVFRFRRVLRRGLHWVRGR